MTVKTTGTELKRFYFDEAFWPCLLYTSDAADE